MDTKADIKKQICQELTKIATMALNDYRNDENRPQFYADLESPFCTLQLYKKIDKTYCIDLFDLKQGSTQKTETLNLDFVLMGELRDAFEPVTDFTKFQHAAIKAYANAITVRLSRSYFSNEKIAVKLSHTAVKNTATLADLKQVLHRIESYRVFLQLQSP